MKWPTTEQVEAAGHAQLALWYRLLPTPEDADGEAIINRICERMVAHGGWDGRTSKTQSAA